MSIRGGWPTGGRRQTKQQREEILQLWQDDPEAAAALAVSRGLAADYPYKLANARGIVPRLRKEWGRLQETETDHPAMEATL
jgi:hypothetical protein